MYTWLMNGIIVAIMLGIVKVESNHIHRHGYVSWFPLFTLRPSRSSGIESALLCVSTTQVR